MNRTKIINLLLVLSLGLNVCGIIVGVFFVKLRSSYHAALQEKQTLQQNLAMVQAGNLPSESIGSMRVSKRTFESHVDGVEDFYAVLPPTVSGRLDNILVVYLHGMGSNYMEPFVYPDKNSIALSVAKRYPNLVVLSCSYRQQASWGRDEAMSDITQNVREIMQQYPIKQIVLVGTSMGGCTALTYATEAPEDIKQKLAGIVSVESAGDLAKLYSTSNNQYVMAAIQHAMGGKPDQVPQEYRRKSFIPNANKLPAGTRVAVVSATQDQIVPTPLQEEIVRELQKLNHPVDLIKVETGHAAPPAETYVKAVEFVLSPS